MLLIAGAISASWYYTPTGIKGEILGFVGLASPRREIKNFIGDVVLPADPEERREVLVLSLIHI